MELQLRPELESKLARMAVTQGRPTQSLIEEAIEGMVAYDDWFTEQVQLGLSAVGRNQLVDHANVRKMVENRFPTQ